MLVRSVRVLVERLVPPPLLLLPSEALKLAFAFALALAQCARAPGFAVPQLLLQGLLRVCRLTQLLLQPLPLLLLALFPRL